MILSKTNVQKARYVLVVLSILFLASFSAVAEGLQHSNSGNVVLVSDIHFNPFANSDLVEKLISTDYEQWEKVFQTAGSVSSSNYGQETDVILLSSALEEIHRTVAHPDFIILSGDILSHDFNNNFYQHSKDQSLYSLNKFIYKTIGFVTWKFSKHYPGTPVYFALGNNDSYTGDYTCIPDGEFLHTTADLIFKNFIKDSSNQESFYSTYPVWGYYSVVPPTAQKARIILLNTNYFSTNYVNSTGSSPAEDQLEWLGTQLEAAQNGGEKVWIIGHIPVGVNVFSTLRGDLSTAKLQWQENYIDEFVQQVQTYSGTITGSFSGHTHMDDFRLVYDSADSKAVSFVHITPSITPVFDNNPAFQVLTYNRDTFTMENFETYYLDIARTTGKWSEEYNFSELYQQTSVDATTMSAVFTGLVNDDKVRANYITNYSVNIAEPLIKDTWKGYVGGIRYLTTQDYLNFIK